MNLLNIIDKMEWPEFLILMAVFLGIVNFVAWIFLMRKERKNTKLGQAVDKIVKSVFNNGAFVDGGVLIALFGVAVVALITTKETVSKNAVVTKQEIKVDDKIYKCQPIRQRVIKYYDLDEKKTKPLPLPTKKECK